MLFANIKKYGIDVSDNPLWQEVIYKVHRKHIVLPEVERAQEFIENNHLPIYSIKGAHLIVYIQRERVSGSIKTMIILLYPLKVLSTCFFSV